jgi:hypothetical protein
VCVGKGCTSIRFGTLDRSMVWFAKAVDLPPPTSASRRLPQKKNKTKQNKPQTNIHDFLSRGEEKHVTPSASPTGHGVTSAGASAGASGHGRGSVGAGPVYEPKRCAEVVAAKYAQLTADDAVQMDKALAVL